MAIPEDRLSTAVSAGDETYIWGKETAGQSWTADYEMGGIALNDPSEGHLYQLWLTRISSDGTQLLISAPSVPETVLYTGVNLTEVSCSFDQNMRPSFAYVEDGIAKFDWYNTLTAQRELTVLGADVTNPRVTLDDKRPSQLAANDVLLFYVRDRTLYMRRQRDRYDPEMLLGAIPAEANHLNIAAMGTNLRLLFEFLTVAQTSLSATPVTPANSGLMPGTAYEPNTIWEPTEAPEEEEESPRK